MTEHGQLATGSSLAEVVWEWAMRILIADDSEDTVESLASLLELRGHEVYRARDGSKALALASELEPEAAILDIIMPVMDGLRAAAQLRRLHPRMVLLAFTGWPKASVTATDLAAFDHYVLKPASLELICDLLASKVQSLCSENHELASGRAEEGARPTVRAEVLEI